MAIATKQQEALYVCDACFCTVLATRGDLTRKWKWTFHEGQSKGGKWTLVLCPDCEPKA